MPFSHQHSDAYSCICTVEVLIDVHVLLLLAGRLVQCPQTL